MAKSRVALIVIGTFKAGWWGLAPVAQSNFVEGVGKIMQKAKVKPVVGYRLSSTPGAFLEIWEGADREALEQLVRDLQAMGYTQYVDARWLFGEREMGK